jgi:hypothetical protein
MGKPVIFIGGSCDGDRIEVSFLPQQISRYGSEYRFAGYNLSAHRFMYVEHSVVDKVRYYQESQLPYLIQEWEWE